MANNNIREPIRCRTTKPFIDKQVEATVIRNLVVFGADNLLGRTFGQLAMNNQCFVNFVLSPGTKLDWLDDYNPRLYKVTEVDFKNILQSADREDFKNADAAISFLKVPKDRDQEKLTVEYNIKLATICQEASIKCYAYCSSLFTPLRITQNNKIKSTIEDALRAYKFPHCLIARTGIIFSRNKEPKKFMETMAKSVVRKAADKAICNTPLAIGTSILHFLKNTDPGDLQIYNPRKINDLFNRHRQAF